MNDRRSALHVFDVRCLRASAHGGLAIGDEARHRARGVSEHEVGGDFLVLFQPWSPNTVSTVVSCCIAEPEPSARAEAIWTFHLGSASSAQVFGALSSAAGRY